MIDQCSGGIELIFNGTNLDVVQNPMLVISDPQYLDISNVSMIYLHSSPFPGFSTLLV